MGKELQGRGQNLILFGVQLLTSVILRGSKHILEICASPACSFGWTEEDTKVFVP